MEEGGDLDDGRGSVEDEIVDCGECDEGGVAGSRHEGDHMFVRIVGLVDIFAVELGQVVEGIVLETVDPLGGYQGELARVGGEVATVGRQGEAGCDVGIDLFGDT